jgi:hypothetical protein
MILFTLMGQGIQISNWNEWCEQLWRRGEDAWIKRDGQDHYYREKVVLPNLAREVEKLPYDYKTLIDLGSGDGHTTNLFVKEMTLRQRSTETVLLIDRSAVQLNRSLQQPFLGNAHLINQDLVKGGWVGDVSRFPSPRIFLSIFVFQELPCVGELFAKLFYVMDSADICFAVFVDPGYSSWLSERGSVKIVENNHSSAREWEWAAKYPISIESKILFLPHFQRSLDTYRMLAVQNGLLVGDPVQLVVPDSPSSREVFADTVYGNDIIGRSSSVLISLRKKD